MSIQIYPVQKQIKGGFNDGEIVENKPIQMSADKSKLQPYSNIFYWAHASASVTSTIGLHPHQGFEIMSFVLKGTIEHYDTKNKQWIPLKAGDVQIIRAGSGISHAEKITEDSHIFQIWLDPDISKSFYQPATYDDYSADKFPVVSQNGFRIKTFKGDGSPLEIQTPGITIEEISFTAGSHQLSLNPNSIHSIYLMEGDLSLENGKLTPDDFIVVNDITELSFTSEAGGKIFRIISPAIVPYETYVASRS